MSYKPSSIGNSLRPHAISLMVGGMLSLWATGARAASLFSFATNFSYPGTGTRTECDISALCDIALDSVTIGNKAFSLSQIGRVSDVALLNNYNGPPPSTGGQRNIGGASLDRGDFATGVALETLRAESDTTRLAQFNTSRTEQAIAETLGNNRQSIFNLNNIIDTEDDGIGGSWDNESVFTMDLLFNGGAAYNSLLLWERGMNSDIMLKPIYEVANNQATVLGEEVIITQQELDSAGFQIDTTEIRAPQEVGSKGITFDTDIKGVRVISTKQFDGPDFKIAAVKQTIPEPRALLGLGLVGGALAYTRRRQINKSC
ncbi:PEP-CTERM sorting domain-containing protein [Ancylothrix sp. C2]|uniref:exosortase-dependent surface protein XDP2 n=1 Tax=Ancylothrix sp. D3o TaxID=2953691 RepID=UPI0021BA44BC|nr:exosortase-dependent surface protein XDP2 [Ancylothrix sp. D3o]MCT7952106.1 PEP-CTERM sorting domain-containing protein [Ancylothrix sp. D3o]